MMLLVVQMVDKMILRAGWAASVAEQAAPATNNMNIIDEQEEPFYRVPVFMLSFIVLTVPFPQRIRSLHSLARVRFLMTTLSREVYRRASLPIKRICNSLASLASDNAKRSPEGSKR